MVSKQIKSTNLVKLTREKRKEEKTSDKKSIETAFDLDDNDDSYQYEKWVLRPCNWGNKDFQLYSLKFSIKWVGSFQKIFESLNLHLLTI